METFAEAWMAANTKQEVEQVRVGGGGGSGVGLGRAADLVWGRCYGRIKV